MSTRGPVNKASFTYAGVKGRLSAGDVYIAEAAGEERLPVAVLCHGFKGFKDWGFLPALAEIFAENGFLVFTFNFSHNGCDASGCEETDLDAFRENRLAYEEEDLKIVLAEIRANRLPHTETADSNSIYLIGHSRGGSAIIRCGSEPGVKGLVLLAAISHPPMPAPDEVTKWKSEGMGWTENARTKTRLPLGLGLLDELLHQQDLLKARISQLKLPICIIHGDNDTSVNVSAAKDLKSWAPHAEIHILAGANHTFGIKHPFSGSTPDFDRTAELATEFLVRKQSGR